MMLFDGEVTILAILLMLLASVVMIGVAIFQIARAMLLPGWRGLLYPLQLGLTVLSAALGDWLSYLVPIIILAAGALGYVTQREDPGFRWFAILSMLVTWGMCLMSFVIR